MKIFIALAITVFSITAFAADSKTQDYQQIFKRLGSMGLCMACADNVTQHVLERPNSECSRLAARAIDGDSNAREELIEFPHYCKWDYNTKPELQERDKIEKEMDAWKHKWFSTRNGEPVTYMFSNAFCTKKSGSLRFIGVAFVGKQTFEFCWEDTGTFVLACRRNDYQVVTNDCESIPRVQLVSPTAKRKSPQEHQAEQQEKQREREDWLRESERARESELREKNRASDARMRAHMERLMNANKGQASR